MILFTNSMILCLIGSGICVNIVSEPKFRTDPEIAECNSTSVDKVNNAIMCPASIFEHLGFRVSKGKEVPKPAQCCAALDYFFANRNAIKKYCKTNPGFDEEFDKEITKIQKNCTEEKPSKSLCQPFIDKFNAITPECETHSYSKGHSLSMDSLFLILSFIISLIIMF